jgi:hypothetical protein
MVETGRGRQRRVGERAHPAGEKTRKGGTAGSQKGATPDGRSPCEGLRKRAGDRGNSEEHPGSRKPDQPPRWVERRTGRRTAKAALGTGQETFGSMGRGAEPGKRVGARTNREPLVWVATPRAGQAELFGAKLDRRQADARAAGWTTGRREKRTPWV